MVQSHKISVIMGVYNCAVTLEAAIQSIQAQTYSNWEMIICDDGSQDDTYSVANSLAGKDSRIILIRNKKNMGLNYTLNRCLSLATGDYIARMDGDDISLPERFEKQVEFLDSQEEYAIVSTSMIYFDETGEWGSGRTGKKYPSAKDIVVGSPICHAPVMMRKECMDAVKGYTVDVKKLRVEDVDLWIKLYAAGYQCYNLSEPYYMMRNDQNAFMRRKYRYRINETRVRLEGCKLFRLELVYYIKALRPLVVGLVPAKARRFIRKKMSDH